MAIIYRTDGPWGAGQGSNLAPAQVDNNFYDVDQRVQYIEDNPALPVEPISITISGYNFYMGLSNGDVLGPVTMTMPVPQWRGDWTPSTLYHDMDYIIGTDGGFGAVMQEHTSAGTFDWAALHPDNGLPLYRLIVGSNAMTVAYSDLTDVALSGLANGDMPAWDSAAGYWRNRTPAQVTAALGAFAGDSGSGGTKGLVPAPAAGDAAAGKVLGASGAWVTVAAGGGGGVTGPGTSVNNNLASFNGTTGGVIKDSGIAAAAVLVNGGALGTPASGSAANLTSIPVNQATGILGATHGGAGSVTGLLKANGLGTVSAAVPDVDYALPGGASVTVDTAAPGGAAEGDLWWNSADGQLYIFYDSFWVVSINQTGSAATWDSITGTPATFPPTLPIAQSGVTNLTTDLAAKAPLASPAFTGSLTLNGILWAENDALNTGYNKIYDNSGFLSVQLGNGAGTGFNVYKQAGHQWENRTGTVLAQFTGAGTYNVSGSWLTISDSSLKTEIAEYNHGLAEILQLRPIVFQYTGPADSTARATDDLHVGLVAQEVEPVMPECVAEAEVEGIGTVKTMDSGPILYALINCCKELAARVEALEAGRRD